MCRCLCFNDDSSKEICTQPKVKGPCYAALPRYYFNYATGKCKKFIYGGCSGNDNNFKTMNECLKKCDGPSSNQGGSIDRCHQPADTGLCKMDIPRYYHDEIKGCEKFIYGG